MKTVLTIAGSDCSAGAGIQADIKTITVHGLYAMSAVTALTAQNTTGIYGIQEVTPAFLARQLECIFEDITPDAVKIGMLPNAACMHVVAEKLRAYRAEHIVLDPVMVSTSGSVLMREDAIRVLVEELFPLAQVVTPNLPEAEKLSGMHICTGKERERAAERIGEIGGCAVLCKGGHDRDGAKDLLYEQGRFVWFGGERIDNPNTHGTGCTLSSAIACHLAEGSALEEAVRSAKAYLTGALLDGLNLGKGAGPLNHSYLLRERLEEQ